jgi:hypothetical protein
MRATVQRCNIVLHPTYAERLWLMTADRGTGVLYEDAPPLLAMQCLRADWVEAAAEPGTWRLTAAGRCVHDRLVGPE